MEYKNIAEEWMEAVTKVLWHDEVGAWLDYDLSNNKKRDYFYPSNIAPLWTGCYNKENKNKIVQMVMKYLQNKKIVYQGGIPTTLEHTGEQWDYPNAWPPLQHMMIVGLNNTGCASAGRLALEIAQKWVRSNYKAYAETEAMFEKVNISFTLKESINNFHCSTTQLFLEDTEAVANTKFSSVSVGRTELSWI